MSYQHAELAQSGRWAKMSILEQMANVGSEVERALNWQAKNNADYSQKAAERALELMDLTLDSHTEFHRLREIARIREALVDYFFGSNELGSSEKFFKSYFLAFALAARINH